MKLTIDKLKEEAINFCKHESNHIHPELMGTTDGKAVGTYIEHKFEEYLKNKYEVTIGSSARGIDLPDAHINTDIKVTSIKKPQSSSPFKNIEQKVYGLGYNLLIFVYEKTDFNNKCYINFKNCIFVESERSGDYNLTKILIEMIKNGKNKEDIIEVLKDSNLPGDDKFLESFAKKILLNPPKQGFLTISNAFQWRLKYNNVINLEHEIEGIHTYDKCKENELSDYQTPLFFTDTICEYLQKDLKVNPNIIIEPYYRKENFLKSASKIFPEKPTYGIEIDNELDKNNNSIPNLNLINDNITSFKFNDINKNNYLVIGNLQTTINNTKNIKKSNNAKSIILKIINEFEEKTSTLAFICKKTESRDIFIDLIKNNTQYSFIKQFIFNSDYINNEFCLLIIQFGGLITTNKTCEVCDIENPSKTIYKFGFINNKFYSKIEEGPLIDGHCPIEWKHGVKHDCSNIMELNYKNNQLINKEGNIVDIENQLVYPLIKSRNLKKPIVNETSKYIIIPQKEIKQDTNYIKTKAPKTWKYLNDNKEHFDKRKSSIYNNAPKFSIFGIGEHSFKKYKVAICGFSKKPVFSLVYNEKSIMLDDTCYFLSFDKYDYAYITMLILNSELVKNFLKNIAFLDSKRPYAKKVLKRIDIRKCFNILSFNKLKEIEKELKLNEYITYEKFQECKHYFKTLN